MISNIRVLRTATYVLSLLLLITSAVAARALVASETPSNLTLTGKDSFTVPFELVDNRIFVDVWLEGRGPAAEAGLKVGDRVVRIDGRSVEGLPLLAAREELKDARRKSVRLTLQDGARTRVVVVTLRDLV